MKSLLVALQFLTVLPIKIKHVDHTDPAKSMTWFPLVGCVIGLILVLITFSSSFAHLPSSLTAVLILLTSVILTGGLHLEGLADTCDGFYAGKNREDILRIMHDTKIGIMGIIGIVMVLLLKFSILSSLLNEISIQITPGTILGTLVAIARNKIYICLILMAVISRWGMVLAASLLPYARTEGTGQLFIEHLRPKHWFIATIITYLVAIGLLEFYGFVLCMIALVIIIVSIIYIKQKIGGITGDNLGALNEIIEIGVLLGAYLIYRA